jgi:hypothetical protein
MQRSHDRDARHHEAATWLGNHHQLVAQILAACPP